MRRVIRDASTSIDHWKGLAMFTSLHLALLMCPPQGQAQQPRAEEPNHAPEVAGVESLPRGHSGNVLVDPLNPRYGQDLAGRTGVSDGIAIEYLTLHDIYERFSSNSSWNEHMRAHIEAARSEHHAANALEDPTINYDVAGSLRGHDFVDGSQHSFFIEWEAPLRRVRKHRLAEVDAAVRLAEEEAKVERESYMQKIREAWSGVEVELMRVALLWEAIHRIEAIAEDIEVRVRQGDAPALASTRVRFRLTELREDYERALDHLVMFSLLTAQLIGIDNWLPLPKKLWSPPDFEERALLGSNEVDSDIQLALAEAEQANRAVETAKIERTPTLALMAGIQHATHATGQAGLGGVGIRIPIFGATRAAVHRATAEAEAANARAQWTKTVSVAQREGSLRNWQIHRDALQRYDQVLVPESIALEAEAYQAYLAGAVGLSEMIDAIETRVRISLERVGLIKEIAEQDVILRRWIAPRAPVPVDAINAPEDDSVSFEND